MPRNPVFLLFLLSLLRTDVSGDVATADNAPGCVAGTPLHFVYEDPWYDANSKQYSKRDEAKKLVKPRWIDAGGGVTLPHTTADDGMVVPDHFLAPRLRGPERIDYHATDWRYNFVALHRRFLESPCRTLEPSKASLFVMPLNQYIWKDTRFNCPRALETARSMVSSAIVPNRSDGMTYMDLHQGADHLVLLGTASFSRRLCKWQTSADDVLRLSSKVTAEGGSDQSFFKERNYPEDRSAEGYPAFQSDWGLVDVWGKKNEKSERPQLEKYSRGPFGTDLFIEIPFSGPIIKAGHSPYGIHALREHLLGQMFTTKHVNRHYAMDMRKALSTQCAAVGEHICSDRSAWLIENTARWVGNSVQKKTAFRGHGLGAFANSTFCSQPAGDSPIRLSVIDALSVGCIPVFFHKEQLDIWRLQMGDWIRDASVFFDHADVIACNNTMRRQWIKRKNKAAAKAAAKAAKAEARAQTRAAAKERWKGNVTLTRQRKLLSATEAVEECTDGTPLNIIDALRAIPESEIRSMREVLAANYYKMIVDPSLVETGGDRSPSNADSITMVIAEMQRRALMAMDLEPKVDRLLRSDWERERVEKMAKQEARRKAKVEARREAKAARAETKLAERRQRGTATVVLARATAGETQAEGEDSDDEQESTDEHAGNRLRAEHAGNRLRFSWVD